MAGIDRTNRTVGMALAGLVGGLLTLSYALTRPPSGLLYALSPGSFGLVLAGYFGLVNQDRSIIKGAGLTAISWATYWLALIVAGGEEMSRFGRGPSDSGDIVAFLAGGVVGGLAMSTATFSLYANAQPSLRRVLVCTVGGGLLAIAGQQLGYAFTPMAGSNPTPALFLVWQAGMGSLIGWCWPASETRESTQLSIVDREASMSRDPH